MAGQDRVSAAQLVPRYALELADYLLSHGHFQAGVLETTTEEAGMGEDRNTISFYRDVDLESFFISQDLKLANANN